jgi:hypothetical protein
MSNYIGTTSNGVSARITTLDNNMSNYIGTTSNDISTRIATLDNNMSNYIGTTSNDISTRIATLDNNMSNYIGTTSNDISTRITTLDNNMSNYTGTTSNDISTRIATLDNNMSNYTGTTSNDISTRIATLDNNMSNYIGTTSNDISTRITTLNNNMSNYVDFVSSNVDERITEVSRDMSLQITDMNTDLQGIVARTTNTTYGKYVFENNSLQDSSINNRHLISTTNDPPIVTNILEINRGNIVSVPVGTLEYDILKIEFGFQTEDYDNFDIFNLKFTLDGTIFYNIILYNTTDPSQHVDKTEVNNTFIYIPYDQISGSKNKFEMSLYKNYQYVVGEKKEVYDTLIYINDNIVSTTSDQSFEITQSKTMFPKNDIHASGIVYDESEEIRIRPNMDVLTTYNIGDSGKSSDSYFANFTDRTFEIRFYPRTVFLKGVRIIFQQLNAFDEIDVQIGAGTTTSQGFHYATGVDIIEGTWGDDQFGQVTNPTIIIDNRDKKVSRNTIFTLNIKNNNELTIMSIEPIYDPSSFEILFGDALQTTSTKYLLIDNIDISTDNTMSLRETQMLLKNTNDISVVSALLVEKVDTINDETVSIQDVPMKSKIGTSDFLKAFDISILFNSSIIYSIVFMVIFTDQKEYSTLDFNVIFSYYSLDDIYLNHVEKSIDFLSAGVKITLAGDAGSMTLTKNPEKNCIINIISR